MEEEKSNLGLILGLGLGLLIGGGAALLLAPTTGKEAREFLSKKTLEPIRSKLTGIGEELRVNIADFTEEIKAKTSRAGNKSSNEEPELTARGKTIPRQPYREFGT